MLKGGKRSQRRGFLKEIPYFKITPDEIILDMMSTSAFFRACKVIFTLCSQLKLMTCEYALINTKVHINLAFSRTRYH